MKCDLELASSVDEMRESITEVRDSIAEVRDTVDGLRVTAQALLQVAAQNQRRRDRVSKATTSGKR
jgi:methyl-accepting chemotaxis protein